jgi:hypothetical protein
MKNLITEIAIGMNDYKVKLAVDDEYNVYSIIALEDIKENKYKFAAGEKVALSKTDLKFLVENLKEEYIPFKEEEDIEE